MNSVQVQSFEGSYGTPESKEQYEAYLNQAKMSYEDWWTEEQFKQFVHNNLSGNEKQAKADVQHVLRYASSLNKKLIVLRKKYELAMLSASLALVAIGTLVYRIVG